MDFNKILYIHDNLGENYHVNIITNGFLLTDEIIKVIVNRDISVYVNFDLGIKNKICERIKDNLLKYKKKYAYSNNIKIITHYNLHSNLEKLDKFYEESKLQIAILKEDYSESLKYYDKIEQSIIDEYLEQYRKLTNQILCLNVSKFLRCIKTFFFTKMILIDIKSQKNYHDK